VPMDAATSRYSIGELSRLTGLPVRTIRFYSDGGLVPEAGFSLAPGDRVSIRVPRIGTLSNTVVQG